ncbi:MAG TPA: nitroreductase family protein, partial [Bacillota bacterium]|nr:nitroreductase family protein [Bacillota bacterium]
MKTNKPIREIIKARKSTRSYDGNDMDRAKVQKLEDFIEQINKEANIKARFTLRTNKQNNGKAKKLGTYGMIAGASSFIVGILDKDEKDAVEFGYLFEKIILFATDLGLGTCWLGGTFNRSNFQENSGLKENEFIPIVSPVGNIKDKARLVDSIIRAGAGSSKRKPWSDLFFEGGATKPLTEDKAGTYATALEMLRIGPSASNKQPWRVIKDDNKFHFFLSRTKGYGASSYDMQKNDIGIAKCHFELTAKELGLKGSWIEEDKGMANDF